MPEGLLWRIASCFGFRISAYSALPIRFVVVSCPATKSITTVDLTISSVILGSTRWSFKRSNKSPAPHCTRASSISRSASWKSLNPDRIARMVVALSIPGSKRSAMSAERSRSWSVSMFATPITSHITARGSGLARSRIKSILLVPLASKTNRSARCAIRVRKCDILPARSPFSTAWNQSCSVGSSNERVPPPIRSGARASPYVLNRGSVKRCRATV